MKRSKKKFYLGMTLVLTIGMIIGALTYSRYIQSMESGGNTIKAKSFVVSSNGTLDGDAKFNFDAAPGDSGEYNFMLDKSKVDKSIPVQYTISFITDSENPSSLFNGSSPIELNLYRYCQSENDTKGIGPVLIDKKDNKCEWTVYPKGYAGCPDKDFYKLDWKWNENDSTDINYQGKVGKVKIVVTAKQMTQSQMNSTVTYTKTRTIPFSGNKIIDKESYKDKAKLVLLNSDGASGRTIIIKDFLRNCDYSFKLDKTNGNITAKSITMGDDFDDMTFDVNVYGDFIKLKGESGLSSIEIDIYGDYDKVTKWLSNF